MNTNELALFKRNEKKEIEQAIGHLKIDIAKVKADADKGNAEVQYIYAMHCLTGVGAKENLQEGIKYLKKASKKNSDAMLRLGIAYYYGEIDGIPNKVKGMEYIIDAMEMGNEGAAMFVIESAKSAFPR